MSPVPAVTFHTRADVAAARSGEEDEALTADLLRAASPWLGRGNVLDVRLHRWRYATAIDPHPERCVVEADGSLVFAVPVPALLYLVVCRVALGRIAALLEGDDVA